MDKEESVNMDTIVGGLTGGPVLANFVRITMEKTPP